MKEKLKTIGSAPMFCHFSGLELVLTMYVLCSWRIQTQAFSWVLSLDCILYSKETWAETAEQNLLDKGFDWHERFDVMNKIRRVEIVLNRHCYFT